jgi:DNA-binding LacI/PurR family transcriptional regulator
MREAGLGRHARTVDGTPEEIAEAVTTGPAAGERPTGVVCYTHYLAVKLLQLWWERRVSVPGDLSMVTFSNAFPVEETIPPLTTMALPTEEMGRTAARMLLEQIEGATPPPPEVRRVVLRETLIVRKSAAAPKVAS